MTLETMKEWIDSASYEALLHHWRFAPAGDLFFQGEIGNYYTKVMTKRRSEISNDEYVKVSKTIGWES